MFVPYVQKISLLQAKDVSHTSDGKYRYFGDSYRNFPLHENCEKILGNFEKILEENRKNWK